MQEPQQVTPTIVTPMLEFGDFIGLVLPIAAAVLLFGVLGPMMRSALKDEKEKRKKK